MLIYATVQSVGSSEGEYQATSFKVLFVSDWIENLARLKSLLQMAQSNAIYAQKITELSPLGQNFYDFVVVDVGTEYIAYALRELRASTQLQNTPVFVRAERFIQAFNDSSVFGKSQALPDLDSERLAKEYAATSMFTKYRAMSGPDRDLVQLIALQKQKKNSVVPGKSAIRAEETLLQ